MHVPDPCFNILDPCLAFHSSLVITSTPAIPSPTPIPSPTRMSIMMPTTPFSALRSLDFDAEIARRYETLRAPKIEPDHPHRTVHRIVGRVDLTKPLPPVFIDLTMEVDDEEEEEEEDDESEADTIDIDAPSEDEDDDDDDDDDEDRWPEDCDLGDGDGVWIETTPEGPSHIGEYMIDPDYVDIKMDPRVQEAEMRLSGRASHKAIPDTELESLQFYGEPFGENYYRKGSEFRRFY